MAVAMQSVCGCEQYLGNIQSPGLRRLRRPDNPSRAACGCRSQRATRRSVAVTLQAVRQAGWLQMLRLEAAVWGRLGRELSLCRLRFINLDTKDARRLGIFSEECIEQAVRPVCCQCWRAAVQRWQHKTVAGRGVRVQTVHAHYDLASDCDLAAAGRRPRNGCWVLGASMICAAAERRRGVSLGAISHVLADEARGQTRRKDEAGAGVGQNKKQQAGRLATGRCEGRREGR